MVLHAVVGQSGVGGPLELHQCGSDDAVLPFATSRPRSWNDEPVGSRMSSMIMKVVRHSQQFADVTPKAHLKYDTNQYTTGEV